MHVCKAQGQAQAQAQALGAYTGAHLVALAQQLLVILEAAPVGDRVRQVLRQAG